jgi:hypothetical protein
MGDTSHLRGHCQHCGGTIEFPADDAGLEASCPYCNQLTVLLASLEAQTPDVSISPAAPSSSNRKTVVIMLLLILAVLVAGAFLFRGRSHRAPTAQSPSVPASKEVTALEETPALPTNSAPATAPRSLDDLKVGPIALEKARGSSLVYAVGVLRNDSSHQRFGVTLELELADAQGRAAGTAKDYRAVLEPLQEWRFRALVLDSKAVSAKVAAIREE